MKTLAQKASIFSQSLDRTAFIAYFLGAVVPFVVMAFLGDRYAYPLLEENQKLFALLFLLSIGLLSLGSFFALRRASRQAIARMDSDNQRLETLLEASQSLSNSEQKEETLKHLATHAARLLSTSHAFIMRADEEKPPQMVASSGDDAMTIFQELGGSIRAIANEVIENWSPLKSGEDSELDVSFFVAAVPFVHPDGATGVLIALDREKHGEVAQEQISGLSTLAGLAAISLQNSELQDAQKNFFAHVTDIIVTALDAHLDLQSGHSRRVAHYANLTGRELDLSSSQLESMHFAALFHDIGMLKIDKGLWKTPRAIQRHAELGARTLGQIRFWEPLAAMVQGHHEYFDGSGYPNGLSGEEIPIEARIIAIAEAFDSLLSDPDLAGSMTTETALAQIEGGAGGAYDPDIAKVFVDLVHNNVIDPNIGR